MLLWNERTPSLPIGVLVPVLYLVPAGSLSAPSPSPHNANDVVRPNSFAAVQKDLLIPALVLAFVPIIASLLTHNFKLTTVQNVVEATDLTGNVVDPALQRRELIREKVGTGKV